MVGGGFVRFPLKPVVFLVLAVLCLVFMVLIVYGPSEPPRLSLPPKTHAVHVLKQQAFRWKIDFDNICHLFIPFHSWAHPPFLTTWAAEGDFSAFRCVHLALGVWCSQRGSNPRFRREGAAS